MIRLASPTDAEQILAIYAPYIRETSLTFETEVPALNDFAQRINTYLQQWPWLVYEVSEKILGYAYASRYRERTGYQWSIECSVYIADEAFRKGIARKLYDALFKIVRAQQFTTVYAVINLPNERSVAFHESVGFSYFATYENVGYKLGKWKNVGWWKLQLNEYRENPPVPILLSQLDNQLIEDILEVCNQ